MGVETVMRVVGTAQWLEDEALIDVVTAVSGSGPAYFFAFRTMISSESGWAWIGKPPAG